MRDAPRGFDAALLADLRARVPLAGLVGRAVRLQRAGRHQKGCCPFHGEKNPSFVVYADGYHCFGCAAHGDHISWLMQHDGLSFAEAVGELADLAGIDLPNGARRPARVERAAPVQRVVEAPERDFIDSIDYARLVWKRAQGQVRWPIQTYLEARGVPRAVLARPGVMDDLLFCPQAPLSAWPKGADVRRLKSGPAMIAVIRSRAGAAQAGGDLNDPKSWPIIGVHATWLSEDYQANRRRADGSSIRKMLGDVQGGCVVLGRFAPEAPLAVGEGIETVLSALDGLDPDAGWCGLAALSLDNLQGRARLDPRGALPMWNLTPDMTRGALRFAHDGPVRVLVDADMKPLRVQTNARGLPIGPKIADVAGGRFVVREISQSERAWMCAQLAVKSWRAAGSGTVTAVRPRMGMDFNDQVKSAQSRSGVAA